MSKAISHSLVAEHTAVVNTAFAGSSVSGFLLNMFKTVFLPILPSILMALAPQIVGNAKLIAVLKEVDKVLDGIPGVDDTP